MALSVDIRKQLGDFRLEVRFDAGDETLALLGASGSGKSMTLKCVAGILTPDEGEQWRLLACETFPGEEIRYDPLALSIGCHTGPGAFGMAVTRRIAAS